ncbi:RagB/SusD family nutrient uptake outer membrane protein [Flavobacterium seoulense]|uniref:Carbohydrate-binding protein SusD n=1 Tax=Flavobacterium seoulense TaxID=1492738 RepID=A0A066WYY2_9FLAO|nr:RagB/SusD family nutrient uptake outer membrane protein [Flavobacterium seoulense]KDN55840.1 carbohydrate-binding protein SusD [Flavobacterium seoulense]
MKRHIIILGLVVAGFLGSCQELDSDFLESPAISTLDESVIFSSADLAKGAVDGIKDQFGQTNSYRGRFLPYYGLNTDAEWNLNLGAGDAGADLSNYNATPTNSVMNIDPLGNLNSLSTWGIMYSGIERANICIRGLRRFGNPEPGTDLGYLLGESLTLRAVYYADLLKAFGDVVARFEPINSETLYLAKSSRDVVYKQIIADLGEAEALVPWPNETANTNTTEKVNKTFVKALRARLALAASGFQRYPDAVRRSTDPELSVEKMYQLALDECRSILSNSSAGHLESSFETLWKKYNQENITAGGESLWEIPFASGRGRMLFTFAVKHSGVDQWQAQGARGGASGPLPTVFYDFDQADSRRDVTCVPYRWGTPVDKVAKQELVKLDTWYFGKFRYEWMTRFVTSSNDDGVNKIYMRYAEVLLMAAETANELEGPAAAAPYLKQIRQRAFAPAVQAVKVDAYVNALTSKTAMFDAIVKEHKFEFTGEMERKQALIRWNLLKTNLEEAKVKMTNLKNRSGEYADVPTTLYYKYKEDNVTLDIYGLNRGETVSPGVEYSSFDWTKFDDEASKPKVINLFKVGVNPDDRQFWPIWQVYISGSNGKLTNDYNY